MNVDIKKSTKLVNYREAIDFLEKRLIEVNQKKSNELIWVLEHPSTFTAGVSYNKNEILDKKINLLKTNRGGKITWHGPGQLVCYFVIDLNKRKKDIRKFVTLIEKTIMQTLKKYKINSFSDRKNIGIWVNDKNKTKKIGAIGIKIKKWIAYHGFSLNINNSLNQYKKIIPCG
nr:lipoyl(octanoyl) transferase LipB [Pelagibacterales bacterium]